jgi:hypothetical protein
MGLRMFALRFIEDSFKLAEMEFKGTKMVELGDQVLQPDAKKIYPHNTGKKYFTSLGVEHTSIDLDAGRGAIPLDLAQPIKNPKLLGAFDVLTNMGTSEHVWNQYECWKNIHNLLRVGGLMIHSIPTKSKAWVSRNHCEFYFTESYFPALAKVFGYRLILFDHLKLGGLRPSGKTKPAKGLLRCALIKEAWSAMPSKKAFKTIPISRIKGFSYDHQDSRINHSRKGQKLPPVDWSYRK